MPMLAILGDGVVSLPLQYRAQGHTLTPVSLLIRRHTRWKKLLLTLTDWERPDRKLLNQFKAVPVIPVPASASITYLCGTLSNAALKSNDNRSYACPASMTSAMVASQARVLVTVDLPSGETVLMFT